MLHNKEFNRLLSIADSSEKSLDFVAEQTDAPMEFASTATRGVSDVLSTAAEQARMYEYFQVDPNEMEILNELATKHGAKDSRAYLQGLIYTTATRAGLAADDAMDVPGVGRARYQGQGGKGVKTRVAIYARVSTVGNGQSPEMQTRELREYCGHRGWEIVGDYVDVGILGCEGEAAGTRSHARRRPPLAGDSTPWRFGSLTGLRARCRTYSGRSRTSRPWVSNSFRSPNRWTRPHRWEKWFLPLWLLSPSLSDSLIVERVRAGSAKCSARRENGSAARARR